MAKLLKIIGILTVLFVNGCLSQPQITFPDEKCTTPNNLSGVCLDILQCPSLLEMLKNLKRSSEDTKFLQDSQCGRQGKTVLVCCRLENRNRFNIPTSPQPVDGSQLLPNTRQCGRSFDNRILGGRNTQIDEYPWAALIEYSKPKNRKGHHCGATFINNRYVVTAAHCVTGRAIPSDWRLSGVRLGEWDRSTSLDCEVSLFGGKDCADPHLDLGIEQTIVHPDYNPQDLNNLNDIALIRLDRYVNYTDFISPVCLPVQSHLRSKTFENTKMDVTGWGTTEEGFASSLKLKASVEGWPFQNCAAKYASAKVKLQNTQMCAGGEEGVDSCNGDSGGPLVSRETINSVNVFVLRGIVSFGPKQCGTNGWPGVYTRVGPYMDWITNNIRA